ASPKGATPQAQAAWSLAVFAFAPLAVVIPVTIASAIGAHTFVGERERGTGEFLAHSPASEQSIYRGKLLATLIPAFVTEIVGFLIYSLVVNLIVGPKVGGWFFPTAQWWVMVLWMLPPFIAIAVCLIVIVSAKVSSAPAAQQLSSLISVPLIVLAFSVASSTVGKAVPLSILIGALTWLVALPILAFGSHAVSRERLLGLGSR
ncbi:MAG: ABC transporter permease subunit, partial [Acidimicrobiia bacterium]